MGGSRTALSTALLAALLGCRAAPPRVTLPAPPRTPPASLPEADDSGDWHGLLIAPFGSALKAVPIKLHEVLLFRDDGRSGDAGAEAECYGADATPPHFLGRAPDEYMLCFQQGRLSRIQASLRLPVPQAAQVFETACAGWLRHAAPAASASTSLGAADSGAQAVCEGREGDIRFSGRLGRETGVQETSAAELTLSLILDSDFRPSAP
ncbi:MAG: hypothetical protein NVS9B2_13420 [Steroidobacteraceae bacterium]